MPTYEYRCDACEHEFEQFQSMTARPLRKCPECGKLKLKRLIGTGAGVIFKGSGFYETDYRSDKYRKAAEAEKKTEGESKSQGESKSDTASQTKAGNSDTAKAESKPGDNGKSSGSPSNDSQA
jgi:putative FmdB family regulatory protein